MGVPYAEVIGDPVVHSKSSLIHGFWLEKLGLDYDYRVTHVRNHELEDFLAARRGDPDWCGCNVTIPHKQRILRYVDDRSAVVEAIGAANCITRRNSARPRLKADNTDWSGFLEPLQPWLKRETDSQFAYVIGAGGAAAAVSYALDRIGFTVISINRDSEKALALRRRLGLFDDDLVIPLYTWSEQAPSDWGDRTNRKDMLVNATPLGMNGYPPLDLDLSGFPENMLVYDLVYDPVDTQLLREARRLGMPVIDGLDMLVGQAAGAFQAFFEEPAPRAFDSELRERLVR